MKSKGQVHAPVDLLPREETPVFVEKEDGRSQEPIWMQQQKKKPLPLPGIESQPVSH
jgi:hypothetical protein